MTNTLPDGLNREDDSLNVKVNGERRASTSSSEADVRENSSGSLNNLVTDSSAIHGAYEQAHFDSASGNYQSASNQTRGAEEGPRQGRPPIPKAPNSLPEKTVHMKRGRFLVKTSSDNNASRPILQNGAQNISVSNITAPVSAMAPESSPGPTGEGAFVKDPMDLSGRNGETQSLPGLSSSDPMKTDPQPKVTIRRGRFSVLEATTGSDAVSVSTPTISNHNGASAYITIKNEEANQKLIPVYSNEPSTQHVPDLSEDSILDDNTNVLLVQEGIEDEAQSSDNVSQATGTTVRQKKGRFIVENIVPLTSTSTLQSAALAPSGATDSVPVQVPMHDESDAASTITANTVAPSEQLHQYVSTFPSSAAFVLPAADPSTSATNTVGDISEESRYQHITGAPLVPLPVPETTSTTLSFTSTPVVFALDRNAAAVDLNNTNSEAVEMHIATESNSPSVPHPQPLPLGTAHESDENAVQNTGVRSPGVTKKGRFVVLRASNGASNIPEPMGIVSSTLGLTPVTLTTTSQSTADGSSATMGVLTTSTPVSVMPLPSNPLHHVVETSSPTGAAGHENGFSSAAVSTSWPSSNPQTQGQPNVWQSNTIVVHTPSIPEDMSYLHSTNDTVSSAPPPVVPEQGTRLSRTAGATLKEKPTRATRAHSAPVERGVKDAVFDMKSVDARRTNGVGRISHYLEEMKEEIQDFDNMNRSLQTHVKIFRDKNKELEAKNRTLERKYLDEKRCREQAEQKIKQLRRKISSMQKELASVEARVGHNVGEQEEYSLPNSDTGNGDCSTDASRMTKIQAAGIEEKGSFSDGEIRDVKESSTPAKHRKTLSMANPTASLTSTLGTSGPLAKFEEETQQMVDRKAIPSDQDECNNFTSKSESPITHSQMPVNLEFNVNNGDEKLTDNLLFCAAPCIGSGASTKAQARQTGSNVSCSDRKEDSGTTPRNEFASDTGLNAPKQSEKKESNPLRTHQAVHEANSKTTIYTSHVENLYGGNADNNKHDGNTALFIAPSTVSLGPTFYQQLGVMNSASGISTAPGSHSMTFVNGVNADQRLNPHPALHRRSTTSGSMTFIATQSPTNDFNIMNQGFMLQTAVPLTQAPEPSSTINGSRAAVSSDVKTTVEPTYASTMNNSNQSPTACHIPSQSLYIAHDHAMQHSAMVKHISDPGGLLFVDANDIQQMQLLTSTGMKPAAKSMPTMENYPSAFEADKQKYVTMERQSDDVEDPFAELVERRSNNGGDNQF